MKQQFKKVLEYIQKEYQNSAMAGSRNYLNVDIGNNSWGLGFNKLDYIQVLPSFFEGLRLVLFEGLASE